MTLTVMLLRLGPVGMFLRRAMSSKTLRLLLRELSKGSYLPLLIAVQTKFAQPTLGMYARSMDLGAQEHSVNLIQAFSSILVVRILLLQNLTLWLRAMSLQKLDRVIYEVLRL